MTFMRAAALIAILVAGCKGLPTLPTLTAYRMDIQQGNFVTQEMVAKLKPGMTQSQVRFILGTPLVVDAFHKDRWDYVYRYEKGGKLQEHRRIVVVFKDEKLARIEGDVVAGQGAGATDGGVKIEKPGPAPATGAAGEAAKPGEKKPGEGNPGEKMPEQERGFFGRMLERLGL